MTSYLHINDPSTDPEMRHEVAEAAMDDLIFLEHDGKRIVVGPAMEEAVFSKREDIVDEFLNFHELGVAELLTDEGFPPHLIVSELATRVLGRFGVDVVHVPPSFRVADADHLRTAGVAIVVDEEGWCQRRRRKSPWELEGIERAQRAADMAMLTARRMLRSAEPTNDGLLRFEGEILTAEWIRQTMAQELLTQGAESEDIIVHSGDAYLQGHDIGSGPVLPDTSCIIDCFPRDRRTGTYTDMTRTFVPGTPSPELKRLHRLCCDALEIAFEASRPGSKGGHGAVVAFFESHGLPTIDNHDSPEPLTQGFFHSLGHGVGLAVHERPHQGRRSEELVEGDVIALEPGLYLPGIGGVRLEDTVLVTEDGIVHFTDPMPYELEP